METTILNKIYIPCEKSSEGQIVLKHIRDENNKKEYVGVGTNEWIVKNGLTLEQFKQFIKGAK